MSKPKNLYESINIYQDSVKDALAAADLDQQQQRPDMLALVTGQILRDTKKVEVPRVRLVDGKRYGFLTLHKESHKRIRGGVSYLCKCDCGGSVYLPRLEIFSRARMRAGCMGFDCLHGPEEVKAWHNPKFALWLQLAALLKSQPKEVDNSWGGRAYDELPLVKSDVGLDTLLSEAMPLVVKKEHRWWMGRKNPVLPYAGFNIKMFAVPQFDVLAGKSRYVMYLGTVYSVIEIAKMFGLHASTVQKWRRLTSNDDQLMEIVIRESET